MLYEVITRRRRGNVIRLRVDTGMPDNLTTFITDQFEMTPEDVFRSEYVALSAIKELICDDRPDLVFKKYNARFPERRITSYNVCYTKLLRLQGVAVAVIKSLQWDPNT